MASPIWRDWRIGLAILVTTSAAAAAWGPIPAASAGPRITRISDEGRVVNKAIVLVPNAASAFSETFNLATPSTGTHCLVRVHSVIVEPNLWNVVPSVSDGACAQTKATGHPGDQAEAGVTWSYGDRVLTMRLDLSSTWRGNGDTGPIGYPEIYYGYSPCSGVVSSPMPADFQLPSMVKHLPNVVLRTSYTTSGYASSNSNLAYDMFISRNDLDASTSGSSISWCGTGIQDPPDQFGGTLDAV